ncbi:hypothetical protein SELMODRAFT_414286 [Selaginella moellendorffii]|uniref:C2H2-type domain-containing protein n=1 Tax=Selaginella moellendorffii TaxID=88036 RepID=D8RS94_SELML|nr:hypothetical protein SELMODRAFT_414286 [Selaginella moellendorffii]
MDAVWSSSSSPRLASDVAVVGSSPSLRCSSDTTKCYAEALRRCGSSQNLWEGKRLHFLLKNNKTRRGLLETPVQPIKHNHLLHHPILSTVHPEYGKRLYCKNEERSKKRGREYMLQHFRDSHGQCSGSTKAPSAPTPTPKVLACSDCGAKFRDHQQLHQHQRSPATHMKWRACARTTRNEEESSHTSMRNGTIQAAKRPSLTSSACTIRSRGEAVRGLQRKADGQRGSRDGKNGNEVLRFHRTTVLCGLGTPQQQPLCSNLSCSL